MEKYESVEKVNIWFLQHVHVFFSPRWMQHAWNCTIIMHSTILQAERIHTLTRSGVDDDWIWKRNLSIVTFNLCKKRFYSPVEMNAVVHSDEIGKERENSIRRRSENKLHHAEIHWQNVLAYIERWWFSLIIEIEFIEKIIGTEREDRRLAKVK